jgi:hypothetical protein
MSDNVLAPQGREAADGTEYFVVLIQNLSQPEDADQTCQPSTGSDQNNSLVPLRRVVLMYSALRAIEHRLRRPVLETGPGGSP